MKFIAEKNLQNYIDSFEEEPTVEILREEIEEKWVYFGPKDIEDVQQTGEDDEFLNQTIIFQKLIEKFPKLKKNGLIKLYVIEFKDFGDYGERTYFLPESVSKDYLLYLIELSLNLKNSRKINYFEKKMGVFFMDALTNLAPGQFDEEVKEAITELWEKRELGENLFKEWYTRKNYPYSELPIIFDPKEAVLNKIFNMLESKKH